MTLQDLRREVKELFKENNIDSPEADSGLLLMHIFNLSKTRLILDNFIVSQEQSDQTMSMAKRRIGGEPIQYIIGHCPFMDLDFKVNPATLIPRQDTEILVETVSRFIGENNSASLWDIGCGSGCIGITLAHIHPKLFVTEFDISQSALDTAKETAMFYNLTDRIDFVCHDILSGMPNLPKPDIIVSNPPYIPSYDILTLQNEVRDFEPLSALDGGKDGLIFYREIAKHAPLSRGGMLAFEIGYDQGESVPRILHENGYTDVNLIYDLSGNPRVVTGIY